jgi:membrane dipeptidase
MRPIIDAHLDLAWSALFWNRDLTMSLEQLRQSEANMQDHPARGRATVSLPEMRHAKIGVCLGTVLVRSKPQVCPASGFNRRDLDYRNQTIASAIGRAHVAYYELLQEQGHIRMLCTREDLADHWKRWQQAPDGAPIGLILAMEGADPIVSSKQTEQWWERGLRCVGLAHYGQGPYAMGTGSEGPVTLAGFELLNEFQKLGMIVDLTHTAEPGFFQVLDRYDGPVHASHNMCRSLVPADRQFSDEQIRALVDRDAVIGMALDAWMLMPGWKIGVSKPEQVSITAVADHIDHICQIAGNARHVGIGSDLDGGFGTEQTPHDLNSIVDLHKLEGILESRGYSAADIDGIFFGNWLRFFSEALPAGS